MKTAYEQGQDDYLGGWPLDQNPHHYSADTTPWHDWRAGWRLAEYRKSKAFKDQTQVDEKASPLPVDDMLAERGKRYGKFVDHARVTQDLKIAVRAFLAVQGKRLADDQQEAIDMICHKIGRIVNGDPNYADNWVDIAGYATLVVKRLQGETL